MATTQARPAAAQSAAELQELAKRHLWMHFTRSARSTRPTCRSSSRGEGPLRLGRSTASATSTGSRRCSASTRAMAARSWPRRRRRRSASSTTTSSGASPTRARSSSRRGSRRSTPGDLNRVFFTSGGSEAVESAIKLARNYHRLTGKRRQAQADRARDRLPRHDARGAQRDGDHQPADAVRAPRAGRVPRPQHRQLPLAGGPRPALGGGQDRGADPLRGPRHRVARRDPRAGAERRRLHPAPGGLLPARPRDLRPPRRAA